MGTFDFSTPPPAASPPELFYIADGDSQGFRDADRQQVLLIGILISWIGSGGGNNAPAERGGYIKRTA